MPSLLISLATAVCISVALLFNVDHPTFLLLPTGFLKHCKQFTVIYIFWRTTQIKERKCMWRCNVFSFKARDNLVAPEIYTVHRQLTFRAPEWYDLWPALSINPYCLPQSGDTQWLNCLNTSIVPKSPQNNFRFIITSIFLCPPTHRQHRRARK